MATTEHSDLEQQIIKTAQQLFIEKGFVETSMSDIAATVGINRPTLHYYFRTKDKMFKAVFGSIIEMTMWSQKENDPMCSTRLKLLVSMRIPA